MLTLRLHEPQECPLANFLCNDFLQLCKQVGSEKTWAAEMALVGCLGLSIIGVEGVGNVNLYSITGQLWQSNLAPFFESWDFPLTLTVPDLNVNTFRVCHKTEGRNRLDLVLSGQIVAEHECV